MDGFNQAWDKLLNKGVTVLDANSLKKLREPVPHHLFISLNGRKADLNMIKKRLLKLYPGKYPVMIIRETTKPDMLDGNTWCPVYRLDSVRKKSQLVLYLPPLHRHNLSELMIVMQKLRGKKGCPWDREQTHQSLRPYLVEEAYEVIEAINKQDPESLQEELGDLLLQVIFHAALAEEEGHFTFTGVVHTVITKLIRRHPHVFGSKNFSTVKEVKKGWEEIKREEKKTAQKPQKSILQVDPSLPALMKAFKTQGKAAQAGFDWPSIEGPLDKLQEELKELMDAYQEGFREKIEEELGDLLFAMVNVSRFMGINPEIALAGAVHKFFNRFSYIEEKVSQKGGDVSQYSLDELDEFWNEAKKKRGKN